MDVFLYGTLLDPVMFARIAGPGTQTQTAATLSDHKVVSQKDMLIPVLVAAKGSVASGLLMRGLSNVQVARLNAYELPFGYVLQPVVVRIDGEQCAAVAYFAGPDLQVSDQLWDIKTWDQDIGMVSREAAAEIGAMDPPLLGEELERQWHMILKRASARLRAQAEVQPVKVRRTALADDVVLRAVPALSGDFFRLASHRVSYARFDGRHSDVLRREVFIGTDASLVLPYDPVTDRVLLVEQFRMGPWARGAVNPWSLEPIAGMIDGGETPEAAAIREAQEEAGLTNFQLEKMFAMYASPGGSTDHFNCFVGLGNLPDVKQFSGGLDAEHEDLRLHVLSFDTAFALIASGEADTGPLIAMLLWLDRERPRLRAAA